jgi:succinate dehydrogenase / fumarate reductase iron-sulfur subunit
MELGETVEVKLFRFDPSVDKEPRYETYKVPYQSKMRVLGALRYLEDELGIEFSYRSYCGNNRCGCCGVKVNGVPMLSCWEPVQPKMVIEPLDNFKHIKDLLVDRDEFEASIERQNPRLVRKKPYLGFPEDISHDEMIPVFRLGDCIECGLCTSACPAVRQLGFDVFSGPAAYVKLAMRALDPRDEGARTATVVDSGIFHCTSCLNCTDICPQDIDVFRDAIEPMKRLAVSQKVYKDHHAFSAFKEVIKESGDVNPVALIMKTRGIRAAKDMFLALALGRKGKLTISQPDNPGLTEIRQTLDAMEVKK